jgi:threonine dehydrogenase-like Zn-dependent dehydrogenase
MCALKPEAIVSHRFDLAQAGEAYETANKGMCAKVVIVMEGEES